MIVCTSRVLFFIFLYCAVHYVTLQNLIFSSRMVEACSNGVFLNVDLTECLDKPILTEEDMSKVNTTLKQLVRDWSTTGKLERQQSYDPILKALEKYLPEYKKSTSFIMYYFPLTGKKKINRYWFLVLDWED